MIMKKTVKTQQNFPSLSALGSVLLISYLLVLVIKPEFEALNLLLASFPFVSKREFTISMAVVLTCSDFVDKKSKLKRIWIS